MPSLNQLRVACVAGDGFEERELTETVAALRDEGAKVDIISIKSGKIQAFHSQNKTIQVDVSRNLLDGEITADEYDALLLPGGTLNADILRNVPEVQEFVQAMHQAQKPIAAICHAPWILISAGLASGKTMTSYETIRDDVRNAGANWVDQSVVEDRMIITSREPADIPAFNEAMIRTFSKKQSQAA